MASQSPENGIYESQGVTIKQMAPSESQAKREPEDVLKGGKLPDWVHYNNVGFQGTYDEPNPPEPNQVYVYDGGTYIVHVKEIDHNGQVIKQVNLTGGKSAYIPISDDAERVVMDFEDSGRVVASCKECTGSSFWLGGVWPGVGDFWIDP